MGWRCAGALRGLVSNRRQIELCEQHGLLWLGSGLTDPDVSLAAACTLRGVRHRAAGGAQRPRVRHRRVLWVPLRIETAEPGLGIEVEEAKARCARADPGRRRGPDSEAVSRLL